MAGYQHGKSTHTQATAHRLRELTTKNQHQAHDIKLLDLERKQHKAAMNAAKHDIEALKRRQATLEQDVYRARRERDRVLNAAESPAYLLRERDWLNERVQVLEQREDDWREEVKKLRWELEMEKNRNVMRIAA